MPAVKKYPRIVVRKQRIPKKTINLVFNPNPWLVIVRSGPGVPGTVRYRTPSFDEAHKLAGRILKRYGVTNGPITVR